MKQPVKGWVYEPEDPSVGIFGDAWWHDPCPEYADPVEVLVKSLFGEASIENDAYDESFLTLLAVVPTRRVIGELKSWYLLTCPTCGAQRLIFDYDWNPDIRPCDVEFGVNHEHDTAECERIMHLMQNPDVPEPPRYDPYRSATAQAAGERY